MKLEFDRKELSAANGHGLEIAVRGFRGDTSETPVQIFLEWWNGKLAVHVWTNNPEEPATHIFSEQGLP